MSLSQKQTTEYRTRQRMEMLAAALDENLLWNRRELTGNEEYDTIAFYLDYLKIPVVSYASAVEVYGENVTCRQVARLSDVTTRVVRLTGDWNHYKRYPIIAVRKSDGAPVACWGDSFGTYWAYHVEDKTRTKITKESSREFEEQALICYKPLPQKSLKQRDLTEYAASFVQYKDLILLFIMALLSAIVGLLLPILNEQLFDKLLPMGSMEAILQVGLVILACNVGNILFLLVKNFANYRITSSVKYALLEGSLERLYHLPQSFIERFGSIDLVSRLLSMVDSLSAMTNSAISAILAGVLSVLYLVRMFRKSTKLTWAALIMIAIALIVSLLIHFSRTHYVEKMQEEGCESANALFGFIAGIPRIRLSAMEDRALYTYQEHNAELVKSSLKSGRLENYANTFVTFMSAMYTIVFYYLVVKKNLDITVGQFAGFTAAFGLFNASLVQIVSLVAAIPQMRPTMERAMPVFETPCESYGVSGTVTKYTGSLTVSHVTFSYEAEEKPVLNDVSFHIDPGEYIGIVGPSGSGKSTLLKLMLGFESPTSGKVYYDGNDVSAVDKRELRRQLGVVLQDGKLIPGTIYENVALAAPQISEERALELLEEAGMGPDLERMPMKILTMVSEFGGTVSGGQQQRILIARALADDPCILLFDEATSALDNKAQAVLCDNLAKRKITRIVIAHRLKTVEKCDRILVLNKGQIVETGSFAELVSGNGLFAQMVKEQSYGDKGLI